MLVWLKKWCWLIHLSLLPYMKGDLTYFLLWDCVCCSCWISESLISFKTNIELILPARTVNITSRSPINLRQRAGMYILGFPQVQRVPVLDLALRGNSLWSRFSRIVMFLSLPPRSSLWSFQKPRCLFREHLRHFLRELCTISDSKAVLYSVSGLFGLFFICFI